MNDRKYAIVAIEMATKTTSQVAEEAVRRAGTVIMKNFRVVQKVSFKGKSDIVTQVDIQSETVIRDLLHKHFPTHSILSEESGLEANDSKYIWILDPMDGTINFYYGSPPFRIGLCLLEDKVPVLTVIYNPLKDELYLAEKGKGATMNDKKIHVNDNFDISKSVVMTHLSSRKGPRARTILALENIFNHTMHMRMFGSGLAAMTYIAAGTFDVFFNVKTNPWDILPGALLIQEAGGVATDIQGQKITYESTSVLATNGKVHHKMLKLLKNV